MQYNMVVTRNIFQLQSRPVLPAKLSPPLRPCALPLAATVSRNVLALIGAFLAGHWGDFLSEQPVPVPSARRVFVHRTVDRGGWNGFLWDRLPRLMVLRKWNKLYVKTGPNGGVTFLLIEKLKPNDNADAQWTAIDTTRRVQVVNLRNKAVYALKAMRGINYDPVAPLTKEEQTQAEKASWTLVRRAGGSSPSTNEKIKIGGMSLGGTGRSRARALGRGLQYLSEAGAFALSYHALGFWGTGLFAVYRTIRFTGILDWGLWSLDRVREVAAVMDWAQQLQDSWREMHDEGSLDIVYIAVGFAAFYIMWWMMSSLEVGYPTSSPPRSPRETGRDVSNAGSEEEQEPPDSFADGEPGRDHASSSSSVVADRGDIEWMRRAGLGWRAQPGLHASEWRRRRSGHSLEQRVLDSAPPA